MQYQKASATGKATIIEVTPPKKSPRSVLKSYFTTIRPLLHTSKVGYYVSTAESFFVCKIIQNHARNISNAE